MDRRWLIVIDRGRYFAAKASLLVCLLLRSICLVTPTEYLWNKLTITILLIASDEQLTHEFEIGTSVSGIVRITLAYIICFTNEFKNYVGGKQLACYCGVVPFEYTSGKSVKGKPHVHNMANKLLKRLLHMGAIAAVTYYDEFKCHYKRKVEVGNPRMLLLKNIRNKMVLRLAAVIKNNKPYQKIAA